ncbi:MAG: sensor histidine kinase [Flavobacteriales bacterium]|nr:sensor histidine kinase [Flavobacteriales bacterium]
MFKRLILVLFFLSVFSPNWSQSVERIEELCSLGYNDVIGNLEVLKAEYEVALEDATQLKLLDERALILERLALISHYLHDIEKALDYSLKAVDYYRSVDDYQKLANLYADLGYSIKHIQLDRSLEYFRMAIEISKSKELGKDLAKIYNNYGTLLGMSSDLDSALYYHLKSLEVCLQFNDSLGIPYSLNNAAVVYSQLGEFEKAFELLDQSDVIRKMEHNDLSWADNLAYRADIYYEKNAFDSAAKYYEKALVLSKKSKFVNLITFSLERLSSCYEKMNDAESAMQFYKELNIHKDSLVSAETNTAIAALQEEFNASEKQKKIIQQSLDLAERDLEIERKERKEMYILFSIFALVILSVWIIVFQIRKRKAERLKFEHDQQLEKAALEKSFVEEKLRIGRELHDNIGAQLTFMISSVDNLTYLEKEDRLVSRLNKLSDFGRQTMRELRTTIWAMKSDGGTLTELILKINELKVSVREVITIEVLNEVDPLEKMNALEMLNLFRIIQEFVQNTVKYAKASEVRIRFEKADDFLQMHISDNGTGFDLVNRRFSGNGLANMERRCEECHGIFDISSNENGTLVQCFLPRK